MEVQCATTTQSHKRMKVFVDMEKLKSPNSGLGVFCKELGAAFMRQAKTVSFSFFVPREMFGFFGTRANLQTCRQVVASTLEVVLQSRSTCP